MGNTARVARPTIRYERGERTDVFKDWELLVGVGLPLPIGVGPKSAWSRVATEEVGDVIQSVKRVDNGLSTV